jgi:hypothetical protein
MSWPGVLVAYSDPYAWRLDRFRWKAALRIESEDDFLRRYAGNYEMAKLIDRHVPPHGRVLTYGSVAEAYTSREILVAYQSGFNNVAGEILAAGTVVDYQPLRVWVFRFPAPRNIRGLRVVQSATVPDIWSVSEVRLFREHQVELPRTHLWRLRASPNPWDVAFAFDNCPITRWRNWEPARAGHRIEVDLGQPAVVGMVKIESSPDQRTDLRLEYLRAEGGWQRLDIKPEVIEQSPVESARLIAADDLKRLGITHLAISNDDFVAEDLFRNRKAWAATLLAEAPGSRLYRLD